jgi:hypothetical protein
MQVRAAFWAGDEIIVPARAPFNIVPWQMLCEEKVQAARDSVQRRRRTAAR